MPPKQAKRWAKPYITMAVIGLCAALFVLELFFPRFSIYRFFYFQLPEDWFEMYRLLTPIFLHGTLLHIAFNTAIFWFYGRQIETILGRLSLFMLIMISGLVSNLAQYLAHGPHFLGLSGVVFACVSFVWLAHRQRPELRFFMPSGVFGFLMVYMFIGFLGVFDRLLGPMAHFAHGFGFLSGLVFWVLTDIFLRYRAPFKI